MYNFTILLLMLTELKVSAIDCIILTFLPGITGPWKNIWYFLSGTYKFCLNAKNKKMTIPIPLICRETIGGSSATTLWSNALAKFYTQIGDCDTYLKYSFCLPYKKARLNSISCMNYSMITDTTMSNFKPTKATLWKKKCLC